MNKEDKEKKRKILESENKHNEVDIIDQSIDVDEDEECSDFPIVIGTKIC